MKKLFLILLACMMLTGCSHSKTTEKAQPEEQKTTKEYVEETTTEEIFEMEEPEMQGNETIALFGVDSRSNTKGKGTRSDCIILAQINHDNKEVRLASILRDTFVSIKDHGYTKINHAYDYGGPDLEIETLNENFDLDIKDYVSVSFEDLSKVVDSIGGVEMEITESETKYINKYINELNKINHTNAPEITKAGQYTLDGTQAVAIMNP